MKTCDVLYLVGRVKGLTSHSIRITTLCNMRRGLGLGQGGHNLVFENWVLSKIIFGPKRDEVKEWRKNYVMRSLMICTAHQMLFG